MWLLKNMRFYKNRKCSLLHLAWNVQNRVGFWSSAPDPAGGAYDAPPDPLVRRGFLPRQSQLRAFGACNISNLNVLFSIYLNF